MLQAAYPDFLVQATLWRNKYNYMFTHLKKKRKIQDTLPLQEVTQKKWLQKQTPLFQPYY